MFNLIVAIISISLIASMAAASIFYGGGVFSTSGAKADTNALVSQGQQIQGAQQLHMVSNSGVAETALSGLVSEGYLKAEPAAPARIVEPLDGANWKIESADGRLYARVALAADQSPSLCKRVAEAGGLASVATAEDLMSSSAQFGCIVDQDAGTVEFGYKISGRGEADEFAGLAQAIVTLGAAIARDMRVAVGIVDPEVACFDSTTVITNASDAFYSVVIPSAPAWTNAYWVNGNSLSTSIFDGCNYSRTTGGVLNSDITWGFLSESIVSIDLNGATADTGGLDICDAILPYTGGLTSLASPFPEGASSGCQGGILFFHDTVIFKKTWLAGTPGPQ